MTDSEDYPLLHYSDLMLALLRTGKDGPATLDDGIDHIRKNLRRARIEAPVTRAQLHERLTRAQFHLEKAKCVEACVGDSFRTTERGRALLDRNHDGVDDSVLMEFAEFRSFIESLGDAGDPGQPGTTEYEQGYEAFLDGKSYLDNPYNFDSRHHLSWENGWFEAADARGEAHQE